jgi:hypothetical protein
MEAWLKTNYPRDMLIPVKQGTKHPCFAHANGSWTWEKYAAAKSLHFDVCVALKELCVIDVDSEEQVAELEWRFPMLKSVTCERTRKGRHYWFVRTPYADANGYLDGAAQRERGIDFKTITRTGTGGIVVVAPSENKEWIRAPWDVAPIAIPDALLDAIATPSHCDQALSLHFVDTNEIVHMESCRWLRKFAYLEPFISEQWDFGGPIPVPFCDRGVFDDILRICDSIPLGVSADIPHFRIDAIFRAADFLGVPPKLMKAINEIPTRDMDLFDICPEMWEADNTEILWRAAGGLDEEIMLDVAAYGDIAYAPLVKDERWLLQSQPQCPTPFGENVLCDDIAGEAAREVPLVVLELLNTYKACMVLAGSSILGVVAPFVNHGHDWDLFLWGLNQEEAAAKLDEIVASANADIVYRTGHAITFKFPGDVIVQVILRLYANRAQVVVGFDIGPAKICMWIGEDDELVIRCAPSWIPSMRHMAFWVDVECWGRASVVRTYKYICKGFDAVVPGTRRAAFRTEGANHYDNKNATYSVGTLFYIEKKLDKKKTTFFARYQRRLRIDEVDLMWCIRELGYKSDYDTLTIIERRLTYVLEACFNYCYSWFGCKPTRQHSPEVFVEWHVCDPSSKCMSMFSPRHPAFHCLYDTHKLREIFERERHARVYGHA